MSAISLAAATRDDLDDLHQLILELAEYERLRDAVVSSPADLEAAMFGPAAHVEAIVARVDGAVAGFALYFRDYSTFSGKSGLYLEDLYVRPASRGAGLGYALLKRLASICVERGYGRMRWAVLDWNAPAIAFYERLGARPEADWTCYRLSGDALGALAD